MLKILFIFFILIFSLTGFSAVDTQYLNFKAEQEIEDTHELIGVANDVKSLLLLNKTFNDKNLKCVNQFQQSNDLELFFKENINNNPEGECTIHLKYLKNIYKNEIPIYRRYLALSLYETIFFSSAINEGSFSDLVINSLVNKNISSPDFDSTLQHRIAYEPLSELEMVSITKILKKFIFDSCQTYYPKFFTRELLSQYPRLTNGSNNLSDQVCSSLDKSDFNLPSLAKFGFSGEMSKLYEFRNSFKKWLLVERFPKLREDSKSILSSILSKSPIVLISNSQEDFTINLSQILLELNNSNEIILNKINNIISEILTLVNFSDKLSSAKYLFTFDFVIKNKLIYLKNVDNKRYLTLDRIYRFEIQNLKTEKEMWTFAQVTSAIACFFIPELKLIAKVTVREACTFSTVQPLAVYLAWSNRVEIEEVYKLFLSMPNGEARLTNIGKLNQLWTEEWCSILILPLGSTYSKNVIKKIFQ